MKETLKAMMFKKTMISLIALVMVCSLNTFIFADGTEPTGNPREVSTLDHLLWISTNSSCWGDDFVQTADIDASATSTWNSGEGWISIGDYYTQFTGTYDGQGHSISNLYINRSTYWQGLFGLTDGATIENVGVVNCNITCTGDTGSYVGGLIGEQDGGSVTNCYSTGSVVALTYVGGLIGEQNGGSATNCYSTASVSATSGGGGFIGYQSSSSTATTCYSTGSVSVEDHGGGLIGTQGGSSVTNCYSTSSVSGTATMGCLGGLIGYQIMSSVTNCYSTGLVAGVSGAANMGGLIGGQVGVNTVTSCFWDTETSGQSTSSGGTGKTTAEMQTQSTYVDWDFTDTWSFYVGYNDDYPYLLDNSTLLIGDFNDDGYVDVSDLQLLGDHWHLVDTDPDWDPIYDLVQDGIINVEDLQVFGDHWHEGTPPTLVKDNGGKYPNVNAGIVFDLNSWTTGNQNLTHIDSQTAGTYIRVDVYCTGVSNLDSYEFEIIYDPTELSYVTSSATNPITFEGNILESNGGTAIGWTVDISTPGILSLAYTLTGTDTTQAPEGEGLIADIVFEALEATHGTLSFGDVYYLDTYGDKDIITDIGTATLPVELSAFIATYNTTNGYTSIEWTTASETDIVGFNVYRSTEDEFDTAKRLNQSTIDGHGTTTQMNSYSFTDEDMLNVGTTYYYWLESVEYSGINTVYTSISLIPNEGSGGYIEDFDSNSLSNFPNPVKNSTTISYSVKGMLKSQPVEISIYNMLGQLIDTVEGKNGTATWNTSNHASGIYFYKLNTESYTEIKKMMLVK